MLHDQNYLNKFEVKPEALNFREATSREKEYIDSIERIYSNFIIFGGVILSIPVTVLFGMMGNIILIILCLAVIWALTLRLFFRKNKYGVLYVVVLSKKKGDEDSADSVEIWSERQHQYCRKISWSGDKKDFEALCPGNIVALFRSRFTVFAARPIDYISGYDDEEEIDSSKFGEGI